MIPYRTTTERGYGAEWQAQSKAARARVGECQRCGATSDLTLDHDPPLGLGGDGTAGLVLCRPCNTRAGHKVAAIRAGRLPPASDPGPSRSW